MPREPSAKRGWSTTWRGTAALLLLLAGAVAALLIYAPWRETPPAAPDDRDSGELAHLAMLGQALRNHADEHDGKYPTAISNIEWRLSKPGMDTGGLPAVASRFHEVGSGKVMDWLYYPGHTITDPPDTILVASPVAIGAQHDHRLVSRVSNVTEVLAEGEFQRQLSLETAQK